ncbi:hypothetical protein Y032_0305g1958 [Ancylostoma ceylanicum]|uniref:Uncharacterized protein n=1 Tax=Ancylostoma ceylanicum TaxID=53326 RepID=A0A016S438_9BILA|nr:hypothetical protein Y032_0305g1958 [Ancylostoma ceylanicum]
MEADRIDSIFLNFWVTAHLSTALDPYPGVSRLLDAGPPITPWYSVPGVSPLWAPVHPYHTMKPNSGRLPTF